MGSKAHLIADLVQARGTHHCRQTECLVLGALGAVAALVLILAF